MALIQLRMRTRTPIRVPTLGTRTTVNNITLSVKIAADIARKSWQTKWNHDVSGFYTRQLIPEECVFRR